MTIDNISSIGECGNITVDESNVNYSDKLKKIKHYLNMNNNMIFLYLGSSKHKIKRKKGISGVKTLLNPNNALISLQDN